MTKCLPLLLIVGLAVGRTEAGIVHETIANSTFQQVRSYNVRSAYINPAYADSVSLSEARGLSALPYIPNDPSAVFDNMPASHSFSGPGVAYWWYASEFPAGRIYWDDFKPRLNTPEFAEATTLTGLKWFYGDYDEHFAFASGLHTQVFRIATGSSQEVNRQGIIASFAISGLPLKAGLYSLFSAPIDLTQIFGPHGIPIPTGGTLWLGWSFVPSYYGYPTMFMNRYPTVHGASNGTPGAYYVGSARRRACTETGIFFRCGSYGSIYNMNFAFNGVPEPNTIALIGIISLIVLRRRKA